MKTLFLSLLIFVATILSASAKEVIQVYCPTPSSPIENEAALELCRYMTVIYPNYRFITTEKLSDANTIVIGCYDNLIKDVNLAGDIKKPVKNGFTITSPQHGQHIKKLICGYNPRATLEAVYALLEKLGYGFYLSFDAVPDPIKIMDFSTWELSDHPLFEDRIVFDWHNFISGCSGWNLSDWNKWIDQSSKMRYNTIMIHAYGNNPMFQYEINGIKKPVGYMNTSVSGRDWGGQHVNDVRLLPGGHIFTEPILGSSAAKVPDSERVNAATQLMQQVFRYASTKGMNIIFALDFDTKPANPQNIILSLPEKARFKVGDVWLANPEIEEGYLFYKAQIKKLLDDYPEINKLALWSRESGTLWRNIERQKLIPEWKKDYYNFIAQEGSVLDDNLTASLFCQAKVIKAFQKVLKELGHNDIEVMYGTWGWENMVPANYIFPDDVTLIPLDWWINFHYNSVRQKLSVIGDKRKMIPVVWAHHDDHRYCGRPYTPYSNFADMLNDRKASGFAIIHWMTFPLDLYFTSLGTQVWNNSKNQEIKETLGQYVNKNWGIDSPALVEYLHQWITNGPMFGMETGNHFMQPGGNQVGIEEQETPQVIIEKAHYRLNILKNVHRKSIQRNKKLLAYYEEMEHFYINFFTNQNHFHQAYDYLSMNKIEEAGKEMRQTHCESTIQMYANTLLKGPATSGEKAIVFSMGTRWYPDYMNIKQRAGVETACFCFAETRHDSLAQGKGLYSWFIDNNKQLWRVMGKEELNANIRESLDHIVFNNSIELKIQTLTGSRLPPKSYKIQIEYIPKEKTKEISATAITTRGKEFALTTSLQETKGEKRKLSCVIDNCNDINAIRLFTEQEIQLFTMTVSPIENKIK